MGFFDSLMGKSSARAAQQLGQRNASQINSGYDRADGLAETGYNRSMDFYEPFAQSGRRGQAAYENTLGLNGADARQQQFQAGYLDDPALAYRDRATGDQINALMRKYNAGGVGVNSGAAALGVGRIRSENFNRDWGDYQNRLMQTGNQGLQVAGQQAGLTTGYYDGAANRAVGRSSALVNNDTQATMAASNARMAGVNNLLSIGGSILGAGTRLATGGAFGGFGGGGGGDQGGMSSGMIRAARANGWSY